MPDEQQKQALISYRRFSLVPACALIGLGVGLLLGYPAPAVLIGLGLGFFASAIMSQAFQRRGWPFSGLIFIIIGVWLIYFPSSHGYLAALIAILLGLLFLVRGFGRKKYRKIET
jgi:membrane-associated phospholipid phosphatase